MIFMKFYYAHYSTYGIHTTWASDGKITGDVFAFESKKERDMFVEQHEMDRRYSRIVCRSITRKEVEANYGRHYYIARTYTPYDDMENEHLMVKTFADDIVCGAEIVEYYA